MVSLFWLLLSIINANSDRLTDLFHDISKRQLGDFGFSSPYTGEDLSIANWEIGGDTIINNDKYIGLTDDSQSQTGSLWSKQVFAALNFRYCNPHTLQ